MSFAPLASCSLLSLAKENPARSGCAWSAFVAAEELLNAAKALYDAGYHLEDVCGLDALEGAVCVYHFDHFTNPGRVALRVSAPREAPSFPSLASIFQGAEWHERETADFYGFTFPGNPNPAPLLLADDMADARPLLKSDSSRAPLHVLLAAPDREVLRKADGFTLMDVPTEEEKEAPAPSPEESGDAAGALPAVKAESSPAVKAEAPLAVKNEAPVAVKNDAAVAVTSDVPPADAPETEPAPAKAKAAVKKTAKTSDKKGEGSNA